VSGSEVAIVSLAGALVLVVIALVAHFYTTRGDAKMYRDNVRTLGETERDRDKYKVEVDTRNVELEKRKASEAAAIALAQRLTAKLKELRHEDLDSADGADLLAAVDRLSDEASGRTPAGPGDGGGAAPGGVPIDPWATERTGETQ
jgi:C4-dicarboxylate-specific signal transduction histidine kinase